MALILSIETATTNCSVALSLKGKTIALKEDYDKNYSHSERLHVYIDEVLNQANFKPNQLDAIAVSKGPGSYTGLRIGVSSAKGLCYSLNIPLISIPTLESLAHQINYDDGFIVSMLDARRQEVYASVYDTNHNIVCQTKAKILNENSFAEFLNKGQTFFIGNGVDKTEEIIRHDNAKFIKNKLPSANEMGALAFEKYKKNDIEDVAYFEPFYLKDFIAIKSKKI